MMIPATMAMIGKANDPLVMAKEIKIPERAPVGPIILNGLPPRNAPIKPAQKAVIIP